MKEVQPVSHVELVSITAKLCLRILANPVSDEKEKEALTEVLLETTKCSLGEVQEAMKLEEKIK